MMSHNITVTRTTTTTTTSAILINTGYLKTWPGLFKLFEMVLGAIAVGLVGYYYKGHYHGTPQTFFLLIAVTFLIGTFLILLSCLISLATASVISKTIYEVVYHGFAFILYLAASLTFFIEVNHYSNSRYDNLYESFFAAAIIGFAITGLYLLSTIYAMRNYRGL